MRKEIVFLVLLFYCLQWNWDCYSQVIKEGHFISIGESALADEEFQFSAGKNIRYDVVALSKMNANAKKVQMTELTPFLLFRMKKILVDSVIPDIDFIEKNAFFYSVKTNFEQNIKQNNIERNNVNQVDFFKYGYDVAYISYKINDLSFLLAFTGTLDCGSTYIYLKRNLNGKLQDIDTETLSKIITKESLNLIEFVKPDTIDDGLAFYPPSKIHAYRSQKTVCLVRALIMKDDNFSPESDHFLNNWFDFIKSNAERQKKHEEMKISRDKLIVEMTEQYKTLASTPQGRAELIELAASVEYKNKFAIATYRYNEFRELPFDILRIYYNENQKQKNINPIEKYFPTNHDVKLSPVEIDAIRKLLKSSDDSVKEIGLELVEIIGGRSLLPTLLEMINDEKQIKSKSFFRPISRDGKPTRLKEYNFEIFNLISHLGNAGTLNTLKNLTTKDMSTETKNDLYLAIEMIQNKINRKEHERQFWFDKRRQIREGKLLAPSDSLYRIDIDKPDPESVSPEGYRNWETKDGLFKTMAKFVGLQDNAAIKSKDVKLLRQDGKEVAIELSALLATDREYIRQQLTPLRDWTTSDSELKLKAKLFAKFDDEIIVQESDGINTRIKIETLSDTDKEYLKQVPLSPHSKYVF
ncbi:MAG: hypothetical protein LBK06_09155 [Planctomycetaceae bacterium]|jgi:hypothetical protein|nr:hypothetical protein [Planctomycetaceae bacterium]